MMAGRRRMFLPETGRWAAAPVFPAVVMFSSVFVLMGILANNIAYVFFWEGDRTAHSVLYWIMITDLTTIFPAIAYCLYSLPAAGLYAEDYGNNATYMRIQRMGNIRYVLGRVIHTGASAGLCAFLAEMVSILVLVAGFGVPLMMEGDILSLADSFWDSTLLQQGRGYAFFFILIMRYSFSAVFYALVAMAFSAFVANRQVVLAIPILYWYFNQYIFCGLEWVPEWLQPRFWYQASYFGGSSSLSDWLWFLVVAGATLAVAVLVFLLLLFRLRSNGIFGGEDE